MLPVVNGALLSFVSDFFNFFLSNPEIDDNKALLDGLDEETRGSGGGAGTEEDGRGGAGTEEDGRGGGDGGGAGTEEDGGGGAGTEEEDGDEGGAGTEEEEDGGGGAGAKEEEDGGGAGIDTRIGDFSSFSFLSLSLSRLDIKDSSSGCETSSFILEVEEVGV